MSEFLYATSHLAGSFSNPNNALDNTPTTWAGDLNTNSNYTSRWALGDPSGTLTGTQTITVPARKGSNSGIPTIALNLYESGTLVQSLLAATNVTSTVEQLLTATFDASAITNGAFVEVEVVQTGASGSPSARNSAQISLIQWEASVLAAVEQLDSSIPLSLSLNATMQVPTASVAQLDSSIPLTLSMEATMIEVSSGVEQLDSSVPLTISMEPSMGSVTASIPQLESGVPLTLGMVATLDTPTASVENLSSTLAIGVDLTATMDDLEVFGVDAGLSVTLDIGASTQGPNWDVVNMVPLSLFRSMRPRRFWNVWRIL
jgi:hypothetical protein